MPKASNLSIAVGREQSANQSSTTRLPLSPKSPHSPRSARLHDGELSAGLYTPTDEQLTPIGVFPPPPVSPTSPKHRKDSSRSFFSLPKASKSSTRLNTAESSIRRVPEEMSANAVYPYGHSAGSTRSFGQSIENISVASGGASFHSHGDSADMRGTNTGSIKSSSLPHSHTEGPRRPTNKSSRFNILTRSRSISSKGGDESTKKEPAKKDTTKLKTKTSTPQKVPEKERDQEREKDSERGKEKEREHEPEREREKKITKQATSESVSRGVPIEQKDKGFKNRVAMGSNVRNRSLDRVPVLDSEDDGLHAPRKESHFFSSSFKENGSGASFLSNIRNQGSKAADGIGKAAKGLAGKIGRSGSHHEKETVVPENWVPRVINLPLVEQTRMTRISHRLEDSKDKTEFWMPALPWRCIDYLNMKGCEEEGLYRVPGSGKEIKQWQMRFDKERDINLFDEPELYDINIIGSMFKAWLRDLPDEIFPKATQARIQEQCAGAKTTPQMLKDELSKLPPFNYYLLFAITCHISLLHSCSEMNKMDYRNLCICFQPCMKIEAFCFQFLVLDWRNCWQGCWTEKEYLAEEMQVLTQRSTPPLSNRTLAPSTSSQPVNGSKEQKRDRSQNSNRRRERSHERAKSVDRNLSNDRAVSSSGSSKPSVASSSDNTTIGTTTPERERDRPRPPPLNSSRSQSHRDYQDDETVVTPTQAEHTLAIRGPKEAAPSLSPMKPLSPMSL